MFGGKVRGGIKSALGLFRREVDTTPEPYPPLARLVAAYDAGGPAPEILYFGDSVVERVANQDQDRRRLDEMLAGRVTRRVLGLSHSAFNPATYLALVRCLSRLDKKPTTAIVPVNMRCFSPQWDLEPAYQFVDELALLRDFAAGSSKTVAPFAPKQPTPEQYEELDRTPISIEGSPLTTIGQFRLVLDATPVTAEQTKFREQQIFSFFYMHRLVPEHRKLVALTELVALLRELAIEPVVYATPINFGAACAVLGDAFTTALRRNVATVRAAVGGTLHDWSEALSSEFFFHGKLHTEHLNERGRALLAERVAGALVPA